MMDANLIGKKVTALIDRPSGGNVKSGESAIIKAIDDKWYVLDFYQQANCLVRSEDLKNPAKYKIETVWQVGKWYKNLGYKNRYYGILSGEVTKSEFPCKVFIDGSDGRYTNNGNYFSDFDKAELLTDLSEIRKYLPDNHPDKIPKYIKCIKTQESYFIEGIIYDVISIDDIHTSRVRTNVTVGNYPPNSVLYVDLSNNEYYVPATEEEYVAQAFTTTEDYSKYTHVQLTKNIESWCLDLGAVYKFEPYSYGGGRIVYADGGGQDISNKSGYFKFMTEDNYADYMVSEAVRRYPIGTRFKSATDGGVIRTIKPYGANKTVTFVYAKISDSVQIDNGINTNDGCSNPYVYQNGKWDEVIDSAMIEDLTGRYLKVLRDGAMCTTTEKGEYLVITYDGGSQVSTPKGGFTKNWADCSVELMPKGFDPAHENVSSENFEVGVWYTSSIWGSTDFAKFESLAGEEFRFSEFILYKDHEKKKDWWLYREGTITKADMAEVSKYLPDGHPDKKAGEWWKTLKKGDIVRSLISSAGWRTKGKLYTIRESFSLNRVISYIRDDGSDGGNKEFSSWKFVCKNEAQQNDKAKPTRIIIDCHGNQEKFLLAVKFFEDLGFTKYGGAWGGEKFNYLYVMSDERQIQSIGKAIADRKILTSVEDLVTKGYEGKFLTLQTGLPEVKTMQPELIHVWEIDEDYRPSAHPASYYGTLGEGFTNLEQIFVYPLTLKEAYKKSDLITTKPIKIRKITNK